MGLEDQAVRWQPPEMDVITKEEKVQNLKDEGWAEAYAPALRSLLYEDRRKGDLVYRLPVRYPSDAYVVRLTEIMEEDGWDVAAVGCDVTLSAKKGWREASWWDNVPERGGRINPAQKERMELWRSKADKKLAAIDHLLRAAKVAELHIQVELHPIGVDHAIRVLDKAGWKVSIDDTLWHIH